jgi:hypothetical protein
MQIDLSDLQHVLPPYYLRFLANYPLSQCHEKIRRQLPGDLEELRELNRFYRQDIAEGIDQDLGSLFLIADAAVHGGETLAIDTAHHEDHALYGLDFTRRDKTHSFSRFQETLEERVAGLLAKDQRLREQHRTRRWWEFWK